MRVVPRYYLPSEAAVRTSPPEVVLSRASECIAGPKLQCENQLA